MGLGAQFNDKQEIQKYLKTDFLQKVDNPLLQLDLTAKERLLFSKFLRYKKVELEINDQVDDLIDLSSSQDQNLEKHKNIVIGWLTTTHFSKALLSYLQALNWVSYHYHYLIMIRFELS